MLMLVFNKVKYVDRTHLCSGKSKQNVTHHTCVIRKQMFTNKHFKIKLNCHIKSTKLIMIHIYEQRCRLNCSTCHL